MNHRDVLIYIFMLLIVTALNFYFFRSKTYFIFENSTENQTAYSSTVGRYSNITWLRQVIPIKINETESYPKTNSSYINLLRSVIYKKYGEVKIIKIMNASIAKNPPKSMTGFIFIIRNNENNTKFILVTIDNEIEEINLPKKQN